MVQVVKDQKSTSEKVKSGSVRRAVLIGLALIPFSVFWLLYMEMVTNPGTTNLGSAGPYPTTISLFANVIFILFFLVLINRLVFRRLFGGLSSGELLIIYVMLTISSAIVSVDFLDVLVPMLVHPHRFATPENGWANLFIQRIPSWAIVTDPSAAKGWYEGGSSIYFARNFVPWLVPIAVWGGFIMVLLFVMLCVNTVLRKQWTENEKLLFPMTQLPLQLVEPEGKLLHNKLMWAGFAVAAAISLVNGMHFLWPTLPWINVKLQNIDSIFVTSPWNAIGWTPISFYPFAIGLGYLLPTDLLFSSWFFYFFWKVERVASAYYGLGTVSPQFPFVAQQCLGAYLQVAIFALFLARKHLASVWRAALSGDKSDDGPMSYRMAVFGGAIGVLLLCWFFTLLGMDWWLALVSFALYFTVAVSVTRMRAELGPPAHDLHHGGPDSILPTLFGTALLGPNNLTAITFFWWFNRAYRSIPIAYQLEGFKITEKSGARPRQVAGAMVLASIASIICGFWAYTYFGYQRGASTKMAGHAVYFGWEAFGRLENWMKAPSPPDLASGAAIGAGFFLATALWLMKFYWVQSPFHPLGLAVSGSYSMGTLWMPMLIAWVAKVAALKMGGLKTYKRWLPFFLGLILGDYILGCFWPLLGWITGITMYSFQQ